MQYKRVYSKVRLNGNKQKYGVTDTTVKRSMLISIFLRLPYTDCLWMKHFFRLTKTKR